MQPAVTGLSTTMPSTFRAQPLMPSKLTMLGLLVGRGSKVASGAYGSEPYTGLYLEDRPYWETAYKVPSDEDCRCAQRNDLRRVGGQWPKAGQQAHGRRMERGCFTSYQDDVNDGKLYMAASREMTTAITTVLISVMTTTRMRGRGITTILTVHTTPSAPTAKTIQRKNLSNSLLRKSFSCGLHAVMRLRHTEIRCSWNDWN